MLLFRLKKQKIKLTLQLETDDDVMLANYKHPNKYIGVLAIKGTKYKGVKNAIVTDKNAPLQHFKVVEGICGIKGSISFESIAKPGHFLYTKQGLIWVYLGEYDDKADYLNSACFYPRYNKYFDVGGLKSFIRLHIVK